MERFTATKKKFHWLDVLGQTWRVAVKFEEGKQLSPPAFLGLKSQQPPNRSSAWTLVKQSKLFSMSTVNVIVLFWCVHAFFVCFCMDYLRSSSWLLLLLAVVGYLCKAWNVFIVFKMNGQISHNYDYKSKVMPGVNDWVHYGDGYSPVVWHLHEVWKIGIFTSLLCSPPPLPFLSSPPTPKSTENYEECMACHYFSVKQ